MVAQSQKDPLAVQWTLSKRITLASGVFFYLLCMILPLVGPAGAHTDHYWPQNVLTFLGVLFLGLVCSGLALGRALREQHQGVHAPVHLALGLVLGHAGVLVVFLLGGFSGQSAL